MGLSSLWKKRGVEEKTISKREDPFGGGQREMEFREDRGRSQMKFGNEEKMWKA